MYEITYKIRDKNGATYEVKDKQEIVPQSFRTIDEICYHHALALNVDFDFGYIHEVLRISEEE